jgi:hypothetical protein
MHARISRDLGSRHCRGDRRRRSRTAVAQIFATRSSGGTVGAYATSGATLNAELITGLSQPTAIAASRGQLFANQVQVAQADAATGAFAPTATASGDSALVVGEPAGGYTVQVAGASGDGGTALAEVYDASGGAFDVTAQSRLVNLSASDAIGANGTLTAGFVIGGSTARTVLIRAVGPGLAAFGVSAPISDPQLSLHGSVAGQDKVLATNRGWAADPVISGVADAAGAFALTSAADSAVLVTLPPGMEHTVQGGSASGMAGTIMREIYEVR